MMYKMRLMYMIRYIALEARTSTHPSQLHHTTLRNRPDRPTRRQVGEGRLPFGLDFLQIEILPAMPYRQDRDTCRLKPVDDPMPLADGFPNIGTTHIRYPPLHFGELGQRVHGVEQPIYPVSIRLRPVERNVLGDLFDPIQGQW